MHHYNNPTAGSATERTSFIWRVANHDATRKGMAAAVAGVVAAVVLEWITPSPS